MLEKIIQFFRGRLPQSRTWEDVRQELLRLYDEKVRFDITPFYYKVTSGKRAWYWNRDTGDFDGTSWEV